MHRGLDQDELIERWTLADDELERSRAKRGANGLGFALLGNSSCGMRGSLAGVQSSQMRSWLSSPTSSKSQPLSWDLHLTRETAP